MTEVTEASYFVGFHIVRKRVGCSDPLLQNKVVSVGYELRIFRKRKLKNFLEDCFFHLQSGPLFRNIISNSI